MHFTQITQSMKVVLKFATEHGTNISSSKRLQKRMYTAGKKTTISKTTIRIEIIKTFIYVLLCFFSISKRNNEMIPQIQEKSSHVCLDN